MKRLIYYQVSVEEVSYYTVSQLVSYPVSV
jgi:hypothetical protein